MIWADWVGLGFGLAIAASALMLSIILYIAAGGIFDIRLYGSVLNWTIAVELAITLPLWLLLRGIDFLAGARERRKLQGGARQTRSEPSLTPKIAETASGPDKTGD